MFDRKKPSFLTFVVFLVTAPSTIAAERVAVLTNGNVLVGEIRQQADRVIITARDSEIRLPAREVEMVKSSILAAYQAKSNAIPRSSSRARSQLIRWCLKHGLRAQARQELERLRRVDPTSPELKTLERQINSFRQPARTTIPSKSPLHPDLHFGQQQLSRLSKPTVAQFVNGIQPLLVNRCALAGCHGKSSSSSFSLLASSSSRYPRSLTHRNLGATLRRIDQNPSEQTLLWMSARSAHGKLTASPLSIAEQAKLLAWIRQVKADFGAGEHPTGVITASAEIPVDLATDPFDPAEFNKQHRPAKSNAAVDQAP